jgi:hypothetical protein
MAVVWSWARDLSGQICRPLGVFLLLLHLRWPERKLKWGSTVSINKAEACSFRDALPPPAGRGGEGSWGVVSRWLPLLWLTEVALESGRFKIPPL